MPSRAAISALVSKNLYIVAILVPISLVIFTYQRSLVPLYGSGPTNALLNKFVGAATGLAAINPTEIPTSLNWLLIAVALSVAPNANYWVAVWTSRYGNALIGTGVTHAVVLLPLITLLSTPIMAALTPAPTPTEEESDRAPVNLRISRIALIYFVSTGLATQGWGRLTDLNDLSESQIYLGLAAVFYGLWILTVPLPASLTPKAKPKTKKGKEKERHRKNWSSINRTAALFLFLGVWWNFYPYLANPVLPHPLKEIYNHPKHPLQVLSAVQSVTGLITVAEWLPPAQKTDDDAYKNGMHSARYLRASHSILGGVWTNEKVMVLDSNATPLHDSFGTPLGDSIYATFVLQEAVRLVNSTAKGKKSRWDNALVIGLGIGTSASSLIRHGISTTVVEIDPAVYDAARTWFGLPDPGANKVFLEDARGWVQKRRDSLEAGKGSLFDIVIHDCFSGGGVPQQLYTQEFWSSVKAILDPEGVVAVNFAGMVKSPSSSHIVNTLLATFGQCRAFHDFFGELPKEKYSTEFINVVLFCTPSKSPLTFRNALASDFLGSPLRQHVLSSLSIREIDLASIKDESGRYLLTDDNNPLGQLQEAQGTHHWEVMREVLPDFHWETY